MTYNIVCQQKIKKYLWEKIVMIDG